MFRERGLKMCLRERRQRRETHRLDFEQSNVGRRDSSEVDPCRRYASQRVLWNRERAEPRSRLDACMALRGELAVRTEWR